MRSVTGINLISERIPDENKILELRDLLRRIVLDSMYLRVR
jgi:hypothetical protein